MRVNEFQIGDRIRVKEYSDIPEELRTKGVARLHGCVGTIVDKLYSNGTQAYVYRIQLDDYEAQSTKMWIAEMLESCDEDVAYGFEFEYLDNVVVAIFYEYGKESKTEVARGRGHIIHEGAVGIAQAASYALKKLYYKMSGTEI